MAGSPEGESLEEVSATLVGAREGRLVEVKLKRPQEGQTAV